MLDGLLLVLVVITALGCGLMGGAFYAFSSFVMAGFRRMPDQEGIAAMQSINVTAVLPGFMAGFFGTTLLSIAVGIWAIADWQDETSVWLLVGVGFYLLGVFVMTAAYHVPRNDRLAVLDPATEEAATYWVTYQREWTRWNHMRALASLAAAAAYIVALRVG